MSGQTALTLNQLVKQWEQFATDHKQINSFFFEDYAEINAKTIKYPSMWCVINPSTADQRTVNWKFNVIFSDRLDKGRKQRLEVLSDRQSVGLDFISYLRRISLYDTQITTNMTPFTEDMDDQICGWMFEITIIVPFANDVCSIPKINS
jgi:hypothetical protein